MNKEKILLILILFISIHSISQTNLKVSGHIETGWIEDRWSISNYTNVHSFNTIPNTGYAEILLKFSLKGFNFETELFNVFAYTEGKTFDVVDIDYTSRLYWKRNKFSIGAEHHCLHPLVTQINEDIKGEIAIRRRSSGTRIFIKIDFKE